MAFDSTLGGRTANSYISLAQADAIAAQRFSVAKWTAQSDANKQLALQTATAFLDKFHYQGVRVWPDYQALQWPRIAGDQPSLVWEVTGLHEFDATRDPLHPATFAGATASGGSQTTLTHADLTDNADYPDDFWNGGGLRVTSGGNEGVLDSVADFVSSLGRITISTATGTNFAVGDQFEMVERLHPLIQDAVFELAVVVIKEGSGLADRKKGQTREALMSSMVEQMLGKVLRRTFDVI